VKEKLEVRLRIREEKNPPSVWNYKGEWVGLEFEEKIQKEKKKKKRKKRREEKRKLNSSAGGKLIERESWVLWVMRRVEEVHSLKGRRL